MATRTATEIIKVKRALVFVMFFEIYIEVSTDVGIQTLPPFQIYSEVSTDGVGIQTLPIRRMGKNIECF
jgi:hypothetical protein